MMAATMDRPGADDRPEPRFGRWAPPGCPSRPSLAVPYRDPAGRVTGWVLRWDTVEGKKILPLFWDGVGWRLGAMPEPRPLLNLPTILGDSERTILIVEGERAAVAAAKRFPDYIVTTSVGGAMAAAKSDWSALRGRRVAIWQDNDEAGGRYADDAARLSLAAGAAEVRIVDLNSLAPLRPGWDLADPLPPHLNPARITAAVEHAPPWRAATVAAGTAGDGAADGWPPLDTAIFDASALPPPRFPLESLGPFWGGWAAAAAEAAGAPVDYVAAALVATVGGLIGPSRRALAWGDFQQPPMLWIGLVGAPSAGKSPALRPFRSALGALEAEWAASHAEAEAVHRAAVAAAEIEAATWGDIARAESKNGRTPSPRPASADPPDAPIRPRVMVGDATREALCAILATEPRGLLNLSDELAALLGSFDAYSGSGADRGLYLSAYDGDAHTVDRIKAGARFIPSVAVGICGGIQPDRLADLLHVAEADDGLLSRFVWIWPNPVPPRRTNRHADLEPLIRAARWWRNLPFDDDADGRPRPRTIPLDEEAASLVEAFAVELHGRGEGGLFGSAVGKWRGLALRLALVLTYLQAAATEREPEAISAETVATALDLIARYVEPMQRRAYGDAAMPLAERDARALARWIAKDRPREVNARALCRDRVLPGCSDTRRMDAAIAELTEAGVLLPAPAREGPGRRAKSFIVRPSLLGGRAP